MSSKKRLYILLLPLLLIPLAQAQTETNPFYMQTAWHYNTTHISTGYPDSSTSKTASSQDFQTIFPYQDQLQYADVLDRVVLNFGTACKATTNFTTVQALNNNTISSIGNASFVALIERSSDCMWAEKLSTAQSIASANYLKMSAAIIYDNVYYPGSDPVINATVGSTSTPVYPDPLQPERNISLMKDNNVMTGALNIAVYFASNAYGTNLSALVEAANANSATNNKEVWLFTAVLYPTCWTNCPTAMGFLIAASKGYLGYIIALAAVFVICAVALNWWRMRRMRNQLVLRGDLEHGIVMRTRATKIHPLPVDILNTYPVEHYSPSIIKNASCAICLDDFTPEKDNIRILPCGHGFCTVCIDPWLTEKSPLCPICKFDCLPPELRENTVSVEQNQLQLGSASPFTSPSAAAAAALATDSTVATESSAPTEPVAPAESDATTTSSSSSSTVSTPLAFPDAQNPTSSPASNNHGPPDMVEPPVDHQNVDNEHMMAPPAEESSAEHKPVIE